MKKNFYWGVCLLLIVAVFFVFGSCTKNKRITDSRQLTIEKLKANKDFHNFITSYLRTAKIAMKDPMILSEISKRTGNELNTLQIAAKVDSLPPGDSSLLNICTEPMASLTYFALNNSEFNEVDETTFQEAIVQIFNEEATMPGTEINNGLIALTAELEDLIAPGGYKITLEEAFGCVVGALGTYIIDNWKNIKTLANILKGESLLSWGTIKAAVQLFFPQTRILGSVIALTTCLISVYVN